MKINKLKEFLCEKWNFSNVNGSWQNFKKIKNLKKSLINDNW